MTSVPHSGAKSVTHTSGPWTYSTEPQPNGCPIIGHEGLMIAMLAHSVNHEDQKGAALANARLISAAPCLLESLIEHLAINERHMLREGFSQEQIECSTTKARSAIAKATAGETRNAEGAL